MELMECPPEERLSEPMFDVGGLTTYCPETWDYTSCWPATPPDTSVRLGCPPIAMFHNVDSSARVVRNCSGDGTWGNFVYDACSASQDTVTDLSVFGGQSIEDMMFTQKVIQGARILQIVGLTTSFIAVVVALYIFHSFRSLRCHRTRIHQHLFLAFLIRLTLDLISTAHRFKNSIANPVGIYKVIPLCKFMELSREYARLCTFAWMFVEGVYLTSLLSTAVFRKPNFLIYYLIGWGSAVPFTLAFYVAMQKTHYEGCWPFSTDSGFYIAFIEAPRNFFLVLNLFLLLNIVRVLVTKLRESQTSETKQVRKAVKATIVLVPLLGIANLVWILNPPNGGNMIYVVLYYYGVLFLDAYQGFFLALLYCFLNVDVRATVKRKWQSWQNARNPYRAHGSVVTTTTDVRLSSMENNDGEWCER